MTKPTCASKGSYIAPSNALPPPPPPRPPQTKDIVTEQDKGRCAPVPGSATWCGLKDDPVLVQCCCNCKHLHPVHYHCCTEPKPTDEQKKAAGIEGRCVCGVQKGWACHNPEMDGRIYDNWPQHSCGCECHDPKAPNNAVL